MEHEVATAARTAGRTHAARTAHDGEPPRGDAPSRGAPPPAGREPSPGRSAPGPDAPGGHAPGAPAPPHPLRWDPARTWTRGPRRPPWLVRFQALLLASDAAVVTAATVVAAWAWGRDDGPVTFLGVQTPPASWLACVVAVWLLALATVRSRSERILAVGVTELQRVLNASVLAVGTVMSAAFLGEADIARDTLAGVFGIGVLGLMVTRLAWRQRLIAWRAAGRCKRNALLVGPRRDVDRLLRDLRRNHRAGFRVVGIALTDVDPAPGTRTDGVETFGLDELVERAHHPRVTTVVLAGDLPGGRPAIRRLGWSLEGAATEVVLPSRLTYVAGPRIHLRPVEGMPLVHLSLPTYTGVAYVAKRVVDVVVSATALVVLSPLLLAIAVAIKLDDGGPVLFRQERVGDHGRTFAMYKFRTMVLDAEERLAELESRNEGDGVLFKLHDDPRVTRVGRVLRSWSLDELPQFLNALAGSMSVVGPRPPLPREVARYDGDVHRRLLSKPGITGLWQVSGRSDLSWEESVQLDLSYVENWSLSGDLLIILRTFRSVLARAGAY